MYPTLGSFLGALEGQDELLRIGTPVSPRLVPAAVADAHARLPAALPSATAARFDPAHAGLGGRALLFERVEGCDFPLAMNVYGSYRRMESALGCAGTGGLESIAARIAALLRPEPPASLRDLIRRGRAFLPLLRVPPRLVRRGACQEVIRLTGRGEVDLARLPLIQCWPLDGDPAAVGCRLTPEEAGTAAGEGRYITFAGMHTIHADDAGEPRPASHNIGMYRAQLVDATRLVMHWHMHHDGAAHFRSWQARGERMPIAICLGGESVLPYAATAPLPPGISELLMAGFLNGRGIPMVRAKTVPLRVPANSEIVIEGWVDTRAGGIGWDPAGDEPLGDGAVYEGPFGDHTGFYSLPDRYPLVDVTAITHRRNAVFPATVVGLPPQEDYYLGKATERIFLPLLRTIVPDIEDYHLPMFGAFHNAAFIRIRKAYPLQARRVMHAIWGAGQMAWTKIIVVVDGPVDVHDEAAVLSALARRCRLDRDIERVRGPLDILDHAAPRLGAGSKIGFDATTPWPGEDAAGIAHDRRPACIGAEAMQARLASLPGRFAIRDAHAADAGLGRLVLLSVEKTRPGDGARAINATWDCAGPDAGIVIAVDAAIDADDLGAVLFHWCANMDPGRDLVAGPGGAVGFDATTKLAGDERDGEPVRPFPAVLAIDERTGRTLRQHAASFGLPE